ncbi:MAG: rRNA maturation RNase YbeY [Treponemataceae bacterium]|nr:MAG: rRNA maturation RNase YbeY [Treponemataceae bacterium]
MNIIDVTLHDDCPEPAWLPEIEPFLQAVLGALGIDAWDLSVLFCGDSFIRELNKQYRAIDAPTDVLSFENGGTYTDETGTERIGAGDIVISIETLHKNCTAFAVALHEELSRLLIHGVLHLSGFDHETNDFATEPMLVQQEQLLEKLRIARQQA